MTDWHGRNAVVTGAGSGLGAALARAFADAGANVALLDIDAEAAAANAKSIADAVGVTTTSARVDIGDTASVVTAAEHVRVTLGGCDILCSNVGVQQFGAIDKLTEQDWQWVLNVNVLGTVRTVREFLPMLRRGQRVPPDRVHRVVERARAVGAPRRVPDEQVRGAGLRRVAARGARATRTSASPCSSRAG